MHPRCMIAALAVLAMPSGAVRADEPVRGTDAAPAAPVASAPAPVESNPAGAAPTAATALPKTEVKLAQAPAAPAEAKAEPAAEAKEEKPAPKYTFGGQADFYFSTNFNNPSTGLNGASVFDIEDEKGPHLGLLEAWVQKARDPVGFRLDLNWGPTGRLNNFLERTLSGNDVWDHVQQAYVSVNLNKSGKTYAEFGRWLSPTNAEVLEPVNNWLYSRSILYGFGSPFTFMGLRVYHYTNDTDYWMFHVNQGWDNVTSYGFGPGGGISYNKAISSKLTATANYIISNEPSASGRETVRNYLDLVAAYNPSDKWNFTGNIDLATQAGDTWYGVSVQAKYNWKPKEYFAARAEVLADSNGFRFAQASGTTVATLTLGYGRIITKNFQTRMEFQHAFSDTNLFAKSTAGTFRGDQTRFLVSGIVHF